MPEILTRSLILCFVFRSVIIQPGKGRICDGISISRLLSLESRAAGAVRVGLGGAVSVPSLPCRAPLRGSHAHPEALLGRVQEGSVGGGAAGLGQDARVHPPRGHALLAHPRQVGGGVGEAFRVGVGVMGQTGNRQSTLPATVS